jgi:hypothetical protein
VRIVVELGAADWAKQVKPNGKRRAVRNESLKALKGISKCYLPKLSILKRSYRTLLWNTASKTKLFMGDATTLQAGTRALLFAPRREISVANTPKAMSNS